MDLKQDDTGRAIVPVLACVLKQLCDRNDRLPISKAISKFHAQRPPAITISDYLHRTAKYALCSGECFVLALVYIDRIIQQNPTFVVNSLNIHRLLITSVMLAAKFFDDQYFNNAYYARVGGVPPLEMNSLEVEFLFMTNFSLFVTTETYKQYYQELWNHAHSNSACGCSAAKVPVLVLPFEKEERERRRRLKLIKQRMKAAEEELEGDKIEQIAAARPSPGPVPPPAVVATPAPDDGLMTDSPPVRSQGQGHQVPPARVDDGVSRAGSGVQAPIAAAAAAPAAPGGPAVASASARSGRRSQPAHGSPSQRSMMNSAQVSVS